MNKVVFGDCRESMRQLINAGVKVRMCVTSPPYWGLRDYGVEGQLGLESSPEEYIDHMREVFSLVKELLHNDGTLWLNLGDTYVGGGRGGQSERMKGKNWNPICPKRMIHNGLKSKNLVGIPWRVALALQADGWILRSDIIWHKPNVMPESVTDRPTKSHEYLFLLSKQEKYYYDHEAIMEPASYDGRKDLIMKGSKKYTSMKDGTQASQSFALRGHQRWRVNAKGEFVRNKRTVWTVPTKPYHEAHFAVYPPQLIEPCILAGSKPGDMVFDPFFGSGTTGEVALKLGRQYLGCELNETYSALQQKRITQSYFAI